MGMMGGFLKQMNDTMQQNRRLLKKSDKSKSKQVREEYNKEIKRQASRYEHVDVEALKERVRKKVHRNIIQEKIIKAVALMVLATFVTAVIWVIISFDFTVKKLLHTQILLNCSFHKYSPMIIRNIRYRLISITTGQKQQRV